MKPLGYQGIAFGIMDGVITALGILMGLSAFQNKLILFIGIIVTGIADAFANAAGMHVSEEMEKLHERYEVWKTTFYTFFSTVLVFMILGIPILFIQFSQAIFVSWFIGMFLLVWLGYFVSGGKDKLKIIFEYVVAGIVISLISFLIGSYARIFLG
jgi:VIT1/CCC1 family predicted Fe2+/Mn2+ transporter